MKFNKTKKKDTQELVHKKEVYKKKYLLIVHLKKDDDKSWIKNFKTDKTLICFIFTNWLSKWFVLKKDELNKNLTSYNRGDISSPNWLE